MQPVVYHVAVSLDGYIAGPGGAIDKFSMVGDHVADYLASLDRYEVAIMGRKTYQVGLDFGVTDPYPKLETYVFSRSLSESPNPRVRVVGEDPVGTVRRLRESDGAGIYLAGGAELATQLLTEQLIDEVVLKVNPMLLGGGIPLFAPGAPFAALELVSTQVYTSGVVVTRHRVVR